MGRVNPTGLTIRQVLRFASLITQRLNVQYPVDPASVSNAIATVRLVARFENEFRRAREALEQAILTRPEYKAMLFEQHVRDQQQEEHEEEKDPHWR